MDISFLESVFQENSSREAMVWRNQSFTYRWILDEVYQALKQIREEGISPGMVVSLEGDFSPRTVSFLLALIQHDCIVVPLSDSVKAKVPEFRSIAQVQRTIQFTSLDLPLFGHENYERNSPLYETLTERNHPGLVLFSSGSTGKSKATVHDFASLLEKYRVRRLARRTLTFLLFDHIGGLNTLFHVLSNGGTVITVKGRLPDEIASAIMRHQVEVLPTSPTFLNLLLLSEAYKRYDLSSLRLVTYGTEVMPEALLRRFRALFPSIEMLQTYGLSEVGILRSKSRSSDSLEIKVGGEGFETRVVNGLLEIKAKSAMLGYLNAEDPFTEDGWFKTGDFVEAHGEYLRILGRKSEIINVGGEKVFPAEVESVLQTMENVEDVAVTGIPNAITGMIVVAKVKLSSEETRDEFKLRMRSFCKNKLPTFKIPQKIILASRTMEGSRFKKMRNE